MIFWPRAARSIAVPQCKKKPPSAISGGIRIAHELALYGGGHCAPEINLGADPLGGTLNGPAPAHPHRPPPLQNPSGMAPPQSWRTFLATMRVRSGERGAGAAMKCLACGAEMRLMDVRTDTTTVCGIERHTFRCWACAHTAQRLMLNRVRMPSTNLPVVIPRTAPVIGLRNGRPAAQSAWASAIEKVNSKQAELKQRAAATINLGLGSREAQHRPQTASRGSESRGVGEDGRKETLRGRQPRLPVRMADSEFNRVWDGQCPDGSALNRAASSPEPGDGDAT